LPTICVGPFKDIEAKLSTLPLTCPNPVTEPPALLVSSGVPIVPPARARLLPALIASGESNTTEPPALTATVPVLVSVVALMKRLAPALLRSVPVFVSVAPRSVRNLRDSLFPCEAE